MGDVIFVRNRAIRPFPLGDVINIFGTPTREDTLGGGIGNPGVIDDIRIESLVGQDILLGLIDGFPVIARIGQLVSNTDIFDIGIDLQIGIALPAGGEGRPLRPVEYGS